MKIKRQKALHGWVFQITDDENEEIWGSKRYKTIKGARAGAIAGFIQDRRDIIKGCSPSSVPKLLAQIEKAEKL